MQQRRLWIVLKLGLGVIVVGAWLGSVVNGGGGPVPSYDVPRMAQREKTSPTGPTAPPFPIRGAPPAEEARTPTLADCAAWYGNLMVDHWLTVDLARQIERLVAYQGQGLSRTPAQFEHLQTALVRAEKQLESVRAVYTGLLGANSAEGLLRLRESLAQAAAAEVASTTEGVTLLQTMGQQASGPDFRAQPISRAALAPAWDSRQVSGTHYRPRRILFGSTGKVGDDRILPLRFDFGGAFFGFYIPMPAPNVVDIAPGIRNRTDRLYPWMQAKGMGYYYWAGVYNNQNTYVAPWLLEGEGASDDVWVKLSTGKVLRGGGDWGQLNIWNPRVRRYVQDYCEAQARALGDDPFLVCYDYTAEPHPWASQPPGQPQYSGYNDSAVAAFQAVLRQKFGTIRRLDQAWQTNYPSFQAIQPPPDPYLSPLGKATPLGYEFERFRCDSHAQFWKLAYEAYRRGDTHKPVVANAGMFMSGWPVEALDAYQLQKVGVADWVDMHMNNFSPNLAEQIYLYSLCRLTGKVPVQFEYVWTFPRTGPLEETNESDFRTTCQSSVWRNLVWGKKVLVFFDFYSDWPAYHNAFLDKASGYSILRPSACVVPLTKQRALRFNDLLLTTEVATPPIIIIEPTVSILNSPPVHPHQGFSFHTTVAGEELHELLFPKNYPFFYVPEQAVLDGYALKQHQVIILPQAPYLPAGLSERLLSWVQQGGTLICLGVAGIWNPYGQEDLQLLQRVFGPCEVRDAAPGHWKWSWRMLKPGTNVTDQARGPVGGLTAALAAYGAGRVLVSTGPYQTAALRKLFFQTLDLAIGPLPCRCEPQAFELVLREDKRGQRYLFALNPHTREIRAAEVTVAGRFSRCRDLGIGSGVPLPVRVSQAGTQFRLRLHPGEGTVIALRP